VTPPPAILPSWRPGATRDALLGFLDAASSLPVERRVAAFDNDGTLWCEKPTYVQFDFFEDALRSAAAADATIHQRAEYAALLDGDRAAMGELGLERIAVALAELFAGEEAEEFTDKVRAFMAEARHRTLGVSFTQCVYQPMLELLAELRRRAFTIFIVTGGGTEFVRAVSEDLYGVPAEGVVGTLIEYDFVRRDDGTPAMLRTGRIAGAANEGAAKVGNIQTQLGRRPVLAGGNSGGDREMLEWACAGGEPCLALLIDHDDEDREFRYVSSAQTFAESEPITVVGRRLGWTVVSMARDWATVYPPASP
jgi:phosphoglycolate phosphatase-like HAD superfamily hydrolase